MISSIKIKNYRSIKELELKDFKQFNLFVGANNIGKSSILEALSIVSAPFDLNMPARLNYLRNYYAIGTDRFLESYFYNFEVNNQITIESTLIKPKQTRTTHILAESRDIKTPILLDSKLSPITISESKISALNINTTIKNNATSYSASIKFQSIQEFDLEDLQNNPAPQPVRKSSASFIPKDGKLPLDGKGQLSLDRTPITFISPRIHNDSREEIKRFETLVTTKRKDHLINALKYLTPNLSDITTSSSDISFWCDIGLEKYIPMPVMGDGFILAFKVLLAMVESKGGAIFIDEVENGIYYDYLKKYWDVILQTAQELDVQVFATTHSAECVQSFINCKTNKSNPDDSRLYRIEKLKDKLQAVTFTEDNLRLTIENGWEFR